VGSRRGNSGQQNENKIQLEQGSINPAIIKLLPGALQKASAGCVASTGFRCVRCKNGVIKSIKIVIEKDFQDKT
jgi:hypothetical protein